MTRQYRAVKAVRRNWQLLIVLIVAAYVVGIISSRFPEPWESIIYYGSTLPAALLVLRRWK